MNYPAHKTEGVNRIQTMRFYPFIFTGNDPRKGWRIPLNEIKYNEQRDEETGYGYFGARYMDHELMTIWLSVDPMADNWHEWVFLYGVGNKRGLGALDR